MRYKRLSAQKVNKILLCFCEDITAAAAAKLVKANPKTVNNYYNDMGKNIERDPERNATG
jgi:transposase